MSIVESDPHYYTVRLDYYVTTCLWAWHTRCSDRIGDAITTAFQLYCTYIHALCSYAAAAGAGAARASGTKKSENFNSDCTCTDKFEVVLRPAPQYHVSGSRAMSEGVRVLHTRYKQASWGAVSHVHDIDINKNIKERLITLQFNFTGDDKKVLPNAIEHMCLVQSLHVPDQCCASVRKFYHLLRVFQTSLNVIQHQCELCV